MNADDVQRVVVLEAELQLDGEEAHDAGDEADPDRRCAPDEARARRDGDQAGDGPRRGAERCRLAVLDAFDEEPAEHGRGRRQVGVHEGLHGRAVGGQGRAGVEPEPAEPQDAHAQERERQVVGRHRLPWPPLASADDEHGRQCGDAGVDVDDGATCEVEGAPLEQPAIGREHPVGHRRVDEDRPEGQEQQPAAEAHAVGRRPGDERRGDDGEHHLEGDERQRRNGQRLEAGHGATEQSLEPDQVEAADHPAVVLAERQAEGHEGPQHAHQAHAEDVLHEHAEHVLASDHAAVEEGQPRCHEEHQGRRRQYPRSVARVDLRRR